MSIRKRALRIFASVFILVFLFVAFAAKVLLLDDIAMHEKGEAQAHVLRAVNSLYDEVYKLKALSEDYAFWDATYEYALDRNKEYEETNLVQSTYSTLDIQFIVVVDKQGRVIYQRFHNPESPISNAFPDSLSKLLFESRLLQLNDDAISSSRFGLLLWKALPVIVSANPIMQSNDLGPARGMFIMGRLVGDELLEKLARRTLLSLSFAKEGIAPAEDYTQARLASGRPVAIATYPVSNNELIGEVAIQDLFGNEITHLRVDLQREYFVRSTRSVHIFAAFLGLFAVTGLAYFWYRLEVGVIRRLRLLVDDSKKILDTKEYSRRVELRDPDGMQDEIRELVHITNDLLSELERKRK